MVPLLQFIKKSSNFSSKNPLTLIPITLWSYFVIHYFIVKNKWKKNLLWWKFDHLKKINAAFSRTHLTEQQQKQGINMYNDPVNKILFDIKFFLLLTTHLYIFHEINQNIISHFIQYNGVNGNWMQFLNIGQFGVIYFNPLHWSKIKCS